MMSIERRAGASGYSVVEAMVAMAVAVVIFGGAFTVIVGNTKTYTTQTEVAEMRQNARNAVEFLGRDIIQAGYGMSNVPSGIAMIIANEPQSLGAASTTAITLRYNGLDVWTTLDADMPQPSSELKVTEIAGFADGMRVMIWDDTGTFDWLVITQVQTSYHLQHNTTNCSKAYHVVDNTVVGAVNELVYRWNATTRRLERSHDASPFYTLAENIEAFQLRYWDENDTEIFPATDSARRAIRKVGIRLVARTAQPDRTTGQIRRYVVDTEIVPRNMPYLPQI